VVRDQMVLRGPFYRGEHQDRRDGSGWRIARARRRATRQTTARGFCPYAVVLATLERVGGAVSTWREKAHQRTTPRRPRTHAGRATLGPRRHPFGSACSVSSVGCVRPRRRAPGAGISIVQRWHSGAAER
jgi:hypothetical protein